ncbi:hypothetical protein G6L41_004360 [Agrobacterium tumefaciens]|uniref:hypothetical protein n=1 Tax=Agrobacterium tumefaciens TaxID=358 RepID=UPI0015749CCF|nr:hypothetical protein [Agrobacterium tumefaciens]WCK14108.1 hypothetical protein G6L41_004360 [Agrobacterium tumefaciens]
MPDAQLMVLLWNVFFAKMRPIAAIIPARNCPYPEDETVSIKRAHAVLKMKRSFNSLLNGWLQRYSFTYNLIYRITF